MYKTGGKKDPKKIYLEYKDLSHSVPWTMIAVLFVSQTKKKMFQKKKEENATKERTKPSTKKCCNFFFFFFFVFFVFFCLTRTVASWE